MRSSSLAFVAGLTAGCFLLRAAPPVRIVPTPQYLEPLQRTLSVAAGGALRIIAGPAAGAPQTKLKIAADFLRRELEQVDPSVKVSIEGAGARSSGELRMFLWDYAAGQEPPVTLNFLDRQTLGDSAHYGQSYVIKTPDETSLWIIGATDQGALLGAMSLLQLIHKAPDGVRIPGVYIRDYPAFQFRAAADWLLNVEINRWALDRGQGVEAYARLCERKLDEALRFKINMVLIDGFGWGLKQRFPAYSELMRGLNRYARERGIRLIYGGYGASYGIAYQTGPLYEEGAYLGEVFKNREWYPDGPVYRCMGFPHARKDVDPSTLGSCRGNEELNRLKAEELRNFVDAVEPGALYIHHEDFGGFSGTEKVWRQRCQRCRKRWPNDSLAALDGGAGGLANGYSAFIRAVNSVKKPATGYDASRDCQIILVSPVYVPDSPSSQDWSNALEVWQNIGRQIPKAENVQVCFREVFPQQYGNETWTQAFSRAMGAAGLNFGIYLFFAGGADNFLSDYPLSGSPALNAMFRGARSLYNASGDFYEEPMEILNAAYSWNTRSGGCFRHPLRNTEALDLWRRYIYQENQPKELFGHGGLFETACELLYGLTAGPIMQKYYNESAWLPDREAAGSPDGRYDYARVHSYLPMTWNRAYAVPSHWRHLALDSKTWGIEISNDAYAAAVTALKIDRSELHRRLARRWQIVSELNTKGARYIEQALGSKPLPRSVEDLRFLQTSFRVYQPLTEALAQFHKGLEIYFSPRKDTAAMRRDFQAALGKAKQATQLAAEAFPQPVDPVGGEVGAIRIYSGRLVDSIEKMLREL
jgi:hypothetical protein